MTLTLLGSTIVISNIEKSDFMPRICISYQLLEDPQVCLKREQSLQFHRYELVSVGVWE